MKYRLPLFSTLLFVFFLEIIIASPVNAVIKIMPLGNSITQGYSSGVPDEDPLYQVSYRWKLWDLLVTNGYDIDFVGSLNNGSAVFGDTDLDDHEGHTGERADQIRDNIYNWLVANPADIILLHVGTNDLYWDPLYWGPQDPADVAAEVSQILDEIDRYELDYGVDIPVILALIINQWYYTCGNPSPTTTFNDDVNDIALARIISGDIIEIVDMECGADIDYREQPVGDMWDDLHPFETGYEKMADVWFSSIFEITHPVADAGPDQNEYEGNTVTLDASNSVDPDGMIDSYFWEQMPGGSPVVLSDPEVVNPTFTAPEVGLGGETLSFQVTVTDDDGLESTDTISVYISPGVTDELAVDFGANGLWHYDGTNWEKLTDSDPEDDLEGWSGGLAVDLGTNGLWNYDGTNWTEKTSWNPGSGGMVGWNGGLAVDFDGNGLWNFNGTTWSKKTSWNPDDDLAGWDGGLAVDFGTNGLWNYDGSIWSKKTSWNAGSGGMAGWNGGLAVDFDGNGLWNYNGTTWSKKTSWDPGSGGMAGWAGGLSVDFDENGLWNYDGTTWSKNSSWDPEGMRAMGNGLAVDFGANGIWYYDGSTWSKIINWDAENMTNVSFH